MEQFDISEDTPTLQEDPSSPALKTRVVGYLWVASRGKDACPKCAALHGKEFFHEPKPGQASVEEMPKGQLHPNCRCTEKPITELLPLEGNKKPFNPTKKPYMVGKVEHGLFGELVRVKSLNSLGWAPIHGRY